MSNFYQRNRLEFQALGMMISILTIIAVCAVGADAWHDKNSCDDHAEMTDHLTTWTYPGGCYIDVDGKLIPINNWEVQEKK